MEYETGECKSCEKLAEKIAAIERERDESRKWAAAQARFINKLEAENALLRKRLEPIEIVHRNWHDYKGDSPMRFADYMSAIYRCMELKE